MTNAQNVAARADDATGTAERATGTGERPRGPLERAAADARRRAVDDPELSRVRVLLAWLRPDCADPMEPPPPEAESTAAPMPRDPTASHGGVPRGVSFGGSLADFERAETAQGLVDVLAEVDALPDPHPAVLRRLRTSGSLAQGLRGLYADMGVWAATQRMAPDGTLAVWHADFGARRDGAPALGRRVILAAATARGM